MTDDTNTVHRISEREAAENLSGVLDRARDGESFEITRGDEVVARIVPSVLEPTIEVVKKSCTVEQFVALWQRLPRLDPEDAAAFEADLAAIRKEFPMQEREWD